MKEVDMYKKLNMVLPGIFMQRIESVTGLGIPDVAYAVEDVAGWIELKTLTRKPKNIVSIPWRPGQLAWYHKYRHKSTAPYFLILAILDDWYCITAIKEKYIMDELQEYYIGNTKSLVAYSTMLHKLLAKRI